MGWKRELRVRSFLFERGWQLLYHDIEILGVQCDLLFRDPGGLLTVVEVKSARGPVGIGLKQRRRLERVCRFLGAWEPVELKLAQVSRGTVRVIPLD